MTMNLHIAAKAIVANALAKGWVSFKPVERSHFYERYDKPRRARFTKMGLTTQGEPRKRRRDVPPKILAAAQRDGVSVTAIYNRIKRTGRMTR